MERFSGSHRGIVVAAAASLAAVSLVGCGGGSSNSASTYVIAGTQDLSGGTAVLSVPYTEGLRTYVKWINDRGGVNGKKLKVDVLDDAGNPDRGLTNARQLLNKKPVAFLAPPTSAVTLAIQPQLERAKVPNMAYTPVEELLKDSEYFATGISSTDSYLIQLAYIKSLSPQTKPKISFFTIDSPAQTDARKAASAAAEKLGWTVGAQEVYAPGSTDFSAQAQRIRSANPEYLVAGVLPDALPLTVKALDNVGVHVPIVNFAPGSSEVGLENAKSDKVFGTRTFTEPQNVAADSDLGSAVKKYGVSKDATSSVLFTQGWIAGMLFVDGLKDCGKSCDGAGLTKSLEKINNLGIGDLGPALSLSSNEHQATHNGQIFIWDTKTSKSKAITDFLAPSDLG